MSGVLSTIASIGMACGPPLIYADQALSIYRKKDSSGFSHDVCGVILIANITRCFFFIGHPFEMTLIIQSLLLILSQLFLLALCLTYRPHSSFHNSVSLPPLSPLPPSSSSFESARSPLPSHQHDAGTAPVYLSRKSIFSGGDKRPYDFWQWERLSTYVEVLAGLIVVLGIAQIILGRRAWYVESLGFLALSIESTLPIPQFISNHARKTTHGFRETTLAGWLGGDLFKTAYFFVKGSPMQFMVTALMTVGFDLAVLAQRIYYGNKPPTSEVVVDAESYEHVVGDEEDYRDAEGESENLRGQQQV